MQNTPTAQKVVLYIGRCTVCKREARYTPYIDVNESLSDCIADLFRLIGDNEICQHNVFVNIWGLDTWEDKDYVDGMGKKVADEVSVYLNMDRPIQFDKNSYDKWNMFQIVSDMFPDEWKTTPSDRGDTILIYENKASLVDILSRLRRTGEFTKRAR